MSLFGFDERPIRVSAFGKTDMGQRRSDNQDNFLIADLSTGDSDGVRLHSEMETLFPVSTAELAVGPRGTLAVVADGMGGAAGGQLASKVAISTIYSELVSHWGADRVDTPEQFALRLREAVETANRQIHELARQQPQYHGMGTTVTAVGVLETFLYLAQVGDSRAYLIRRGEVKQLTRDQSLVQQLVDAGTMTEEEAEGSDHANLLLQALGTDRNVRVDLSYQELRSDDLVVLCSDGLTRTVRREDIASLAVRAPDPACLCTELVALANQRGAPDNVTVLALRVTGDRLGAPRNSDFVGYRGYDVTP